MASYYEVAPLDLSKCADLHCSVQDDENKEVAEFRVLSKKLFVLVGTISNALHDSFLKSFCPDAVNLFLTVKNNLEMSNRWVNRVYEARCLLCESLRTLLEDTKPIVAKGHSECWRSSTLSEFFSPSPNEIRERQRAILRYNWIPEIF
jgi:hypothetical protein